MYTGIFFAVSLPEGEKCIIPECHRRRYKDGMITHPYCSRSHAEEGKRRQIFRKCTCVHTYNLHSYNSIDMTFHILYSLYHACMCFVHTRIYYVGVCDCMCACMCVCVCMCVCMCVCFCVCVCVCVCVCACVVCVYMYACACLCIHVYIYVCVCVCVCVLACLQMYIFGFATIPTFCVGFLCTYNTFQLHMSISSNCRARRGSV